VKLESNISFEKEAAYIIDNVLILLKCCIAFVLYSLYLVVTNSYIAI